MHHHIYTYALNKQPFSDFFMTTTTAFKLAWLYSQLHKGQASLTLAKGNQFPPRFHVSCVFMFYTVLFSSSSSCFPLFFLFFLSVTFFFFFCFMLLSIYHIPWMYHVSVLFTLCITGEKRYRKCHYRNKCTLRFSTKLRSEDPLTRCMSEHPPPPPPPPPKCHYQQQQLQHPNHTCCGL